MKRKRTIRSAFVHLATFGLLVLPTPLYAQAIGGRVTDSSGGVMPGVTVEASSPSLTEGSRIVVTDNEGRYLLTELRTGVYKVTFTMTGFGTVSRDGIQLVTGFTAPISVEMSVSSLEENITVSGASPIVDVQSVKTQAVTTRDVIESVPTARNVEAFGRLIPGSGQVTGGGNAYTPDVGGSTRMQQQPLAFRGNANTIQMVDGFRTSIATSTQFSGDYFNSGMMQEVTYTTSGESAEATGGGMKVNVIPKDGGNTFAGTAYGNYTYHGFAGHNLDQRLKDRGLANAADILKIWDVNASVGGPIKRNMLWFQGTYGNWGVDKTVPGSFSEIDGLPGHDGGHINSGILRITWQANQKHKIAAMYTYAPKYRNSWGIAGLVSPEAAAVRTDPQMAHGILKWTSTLSNKLIAQAGVGIYEQEYTTWYEPEQVDSPGQARRAFPVTGSLFDPYYPNSDLATGWVVGSYANGHQPVYNHLFNYIASTAYVTGSHAFKAGLDIAQIMGGQSDNYRGDMRIQWRNGVPDSVVLLGSPRYTTENLRDIGAYVQDVWTVNRITLNGGLRLENYNGNVPEQWNPAGTWIGARITPAVHDVPSWMDLSPRGGISWDVTGNAHTAVKFSLGRYAAVPMTTAVQSSNPMRNIVYQGTARWLGDTNGNLIPDKSELGPISPATFGTIQQPTTVDRDVTKGFGSRPYNWDYAATLQQQLRPTLGVETSVYYRRYFNQTLVDNLAITSKDFDQFQVTSPADARLPGGGGQTISGLYVITDAARPLSQLYTTFAKKLGDYHEIYKGADFTVNWRAGGGKSLAGGVDWGQAYLNSCFVVDSPQALLYCNRPVDPSSGAIRGGLSVKMLGVLPISGWQLSGTLQSSRGPEIAANWATRDANGTLKFTDTSRQNIGATPTVTIPLIAPGTQYDDRYWQFDLRGSRSFKLDKTRKLKINLDLYNVFNGNAVIRRNNTYGPTWGTPVNVLEPRLFEVGAQIDF